MREMWLGREIVVVGLPPLTEQIGQNWNPLKLTKKIREIFSFSMYEKKSHFVKQYLKSKIVTKIWRKAP